MGPGIDMNNTAEKEKEFLACIDNVYNQVRMLYRGIEILKDGRIICYDGLEKIKIYKYIDKKFILDFEFKIEDNRSATCLCEVEENIIIFGCYMKLFLYDIRNNEAKLLQKLEYGDYMNDSFRIIKLSNGLIAGAIFNEIYFYKYDEENKKLEKKDEIKTTTNEKLYSLYDVIDGKYIFISYQNKEFGGGQSFVDVYDIKKLILIQTFETKYQLSQFIKLNDNLIIAADVFGNIHELNIDENNKLSVKDIFRANDFKITKILKFDNNKILSIGQDGKVKLWEFN